MSGIYGIMGQLMMQNQQAQVANMETMYALQASAPTTSTETVDWQKRADELKAKIAAEEMDAASKKRGRESTVLTSPLTDEKVKTTESVLQGN